MAVALKAPALTGVDVVVVEEADMEEAMAAVELAVTLLPPSNWPQVVVVADEHLQACLVDEPVHRWH